MTQIFIGNSTVNCVLQDLFNYASRMTFWQRRKKGQIEEYEERTEKSKIFKIAFFLYF